MPGSAEHDHSNYGETAGHNKIDGSRVNPPDPSKPIPDSNHTRKLTPTARLCIHSKADSGHPSDGPQIVHAGDDKQPRP